MKASRHLVQGAAAVPGQPAMRHDGLKLLKFRLELLVDHQQRLERAVNVTVASGDDLVDHRFG